MSVWMPNYRLNCSSDKQATEVIQLQRTTMFNVMEPPKHLPAADEGDSSESACLLDIKHRGGMGVPTVVNDTVTVAQVVASIAAGGGRMTHEKHDNAVNVDDDDGTEFQLDSRKFPDEHNKDCYSNCNSYKSKPSAGILLTPATINTVETVTTFTTTATKRAQQQDVAQTAADNASRDVANVGDALPEVESPRVWREFLEKWPIISQQLSLLVICVLLWMIACIFLPEHVQPHRAIMRICLLIVGAQIAGILVTLVHLPDMLGMLFFGVLYTNVGLADFSSIQPFEAFLREMALINIMLLVGIGLDSVAFAKLWLMILRLTLLPTLAEVLVITLSAYYMLDMPWFWGLLLGLVITAVSPNVVVSVLLELRKQRLGLNKGIHTLIYALTACNDVVAIFAFGIVLELIFSTSDIREKFLQGPVGIGIGIVFGFLYGLLIQFLPSRNAHYANGLRFVLTVLGGMIAVMGSRAIGYTSAGALGCVAVTFFARMGWIREMEQQQKEQQPQDENQTKLSNADANENELSVAKRLDLMWKFLKPVSFALIGKEINFAVLNGKLVGYGVLLVLLGSLFRLAFAYLSTYGGNLSRKERAYITISGIPKATVQAALGPLALDLARSLTADAKQLTLAGNVLIISVLAIILTAPLGAILMMRLAPHWLEFSGQMDEAMMMNGTRNPQHQQGNKSRTAAALTV